MTPVIPAQPTERMIADVDAILHSYVPLQPFTYSAVDWNEVGREIVRTMFGEGVDAELGNRIGDLISSVHDDREPLSWNNHGKLIWAETTPWCTELPELECFVNGEDVIALGQPEEIGGARLCLTFSSAHSSFGASWAEGSLYYRSPYSPEGLAERGFAPVEGVPEHCREGFLEKFRAHRNEGFDMTRYGHDDPVNKALQEHYATPRRVKFWGQEYDIVPAVCDTIFGDGRRLMYVEPLNTRPNYYVVQVDSTWILDRMGDKIDDVMIVLEERFGQGWPEPEDGEEQVHNEFPAVSDDCGCSWGRVDWPADIAPENAVLVEGRRSLRSEPEEEDEPSLSPSL